MHFTFPNNRSPHRGSPGSLRCYRWSPFLYYLVFFATTIGAVRGEWQESHKNIGMAPQKMAAHKISVVEAATATAAPSTLRPNKAGPPRRRQPPSKPRRRMPTTPPTGISLEATPSPSRPPSPGTFGRARPHRIPPSVTREAHEALQRELADLH